MTQIFILTLLILALTQAQTGTINLANCPAASSDQIVSPPVLNSPLATLVADVFTVNWIWSLTQTRISTPSYQFGTCASVPAPDSSSASGDCTLNQSAVVSWSTITSTCGWTHTSNAGILSYTGSIFLTGVESFLDARGVNQTRTLSYEFALVVDFPENTTIASNITAFAPVLVDHFITKQTYDRLTNTGLVSFQTQVQFPWSITLTSTVTASVNTASVASDSGNPGSIGTSLGTISSQNWILSISPDAGVCVLDGTYTIAAQLVCTLSNQADCPSLSSPSTFNIVFSVTSQDFCAQTSVDVPISGTLNVFSDAGLSTAKTNFELGTLSYYQLQISSPSATITNIAIDQVTVSANTNVILNGATQTNSLIIYDSNIWLPATAPQTLSSATSNGGVQTFSFNLTNALLVIPQDSAVNMTISARASISFLGNSKKRTSFATFQLSTQTKSFNSIVTYSNTQSNAVSPSSPSASSASFIGPYFLVSLCWFVLFFGSF